MKRTIRLHRPEDPELQSQYDEAAQAVRDRKIPLIIDDETRPIWECAQRAAAEVAAWPAWKHTEQPRDEDCCVGDVTRCRCVGVQPPVAMTDDDVDREKWAAVWNDGDE